MLSAVIAFILMEIRHISAKDAIHSHQLNGVASRGMATSLAIASPILVLCMLLGGALIFFVLPRASAGYLSAYAPGNEISTGFSDQVELGQIGEIQQSECSSDAHSDRRRRPWQFRPEVARSHT